MLMTNNDSTQSPEFQHESSLNTTEEQPNQNTQLTTSAVKSLNTATDTVMGIMQGNSSENLNTYSQSQDANQKKERSRINTEYAKALFRIQQFFVMFSYSGLVGASQAEGEFHVNQFLSDYAQIKAHPILGATASNVLTNFIVEIFHPIMDNFSEEIELQAQFFQATYHNLKQQILANNIIINEKANEQKRQQRDKTQFSWHEFTAIESNNSVMNYRIWLLKEFLKLSQKLNPEDWIFIGNGLRNAMMLRSETRHHLKRHEFDGLWNIKIFRVLKDFNTENITKSFNNTISFIVSETNKLIVEKDKLKTIYQTEYLNKYGKDESRNNDNLLKEAEEYAIKQTQNFSDSQMTNILKSLFQHYKENNDYMYQALSDTTTKESQSLNDIVNEIGSNFVVENWKECLHAGFTLTYEIQPNLIFR